MKHVIRIFYKNNKIYIFLVINIGLWGAWIQSDLYSKSQYSREKHKKLSIDTYIPKGFVLYPIEIKNFHSLDSILGKFGVVDIYASKNGKYKKNILVARRVKILRAPLNPSKFALLLPEFETKIFLNTTGPYTVIVQNPDSRGLEVGKIEKKKSKKIIVREL